ncbi:ras-related protein Rab-43 [Melanaphis sacchari]|uniref:Ras-related protein Rab-43 n=1 Tax=Melanaphis sacchari TaxID=742174 RepID=A0A2H8TLN7_9HEMI|nr:ras-related protein Rab-43 [Melanaphis sacchari]
MSKTSGSAASGSSSSSSQQQASGVAAVPAEDNFDFLFKIVLIGDCGTGKTCVVQRFKSGTYAENQGNTIGVDFSMKTIKIDGKKVKLQIWDTAGHERFRTITQSYYRSANGVLLVYDITKRATFLNLQRWVEEVRRYTSSNVLLVLIGNKCDLEENRQVELSEADAMCEYFPELLSVLETSAKENKNIEEAFVTIASELKRRHDQSAHIEDEPNPVINLSEGENVQKCKGCTLL